MYIVAFELPNGSKARCSRPAPRLSMEGRFLHEIKIHQLHRNWHTAVHYSAESDETLTWFCLMRYLKARICHSIDNDTGLSL
jgi:hypothetical protein